MKFSRRKFMVGISAAALCTKANAQTTLPSRDDFLEVARQANQPRRQPSRLDLGNAPRRFHMASQRTGESVDAVYWEYGQYLEDVIRDISWFLRDWRSNEVVEIDLNVIDIVSRTHFLLDSAEPLLLLSGYRSAKTNAMLRRRNQGIAKRSYHTLGMAIDLRASNRSEEQIGLAAMSLRAGGVGRYPRSKFVHLDSGPIRSWRT